MRLLHVAQDLLGARRRRLPEELRLQDAGVDAPWIEPVGLAEVEDGRLRVAALRQHAPEALVQVRVLGLDLQRALELEQRVVVASGGEVLLGALEMAREALLGRRAAERRDERGAGEPARDEPRASHFESRASSA